MSSTNRGGDRHVSDYYRTPQWAIQDFLTALHTDAPALFGEDLSSHDLIVLDPCAGGDAHNAMAYPQALRNFPAWNITRLVTHDYRADSPAEFHGDYVAGLLERSLPRDLSPDLIITNPPFAIACEIIEQALADVRANGLVIMLLRLNFFGGQHEKRAFFERAGLPVAAYVHRKRINFTEGQRKPDGTKMSGDSIEYMHAIWQRGARPHFTQLRVI